MNKQKFKELCFHLAVNSDLCTCFLPSCNRKLDQLSKQTSVIHSLGTITYLCCNIFVSFAGFHFLCFLHCFCSESQLCCTFYICQALGVTILILFTFYYSYEQFKLKFIFAIIFLASWLFTISFTPTAKSVYTFLKANIC